MITRIPPTVPVVFRYKSILKTYWLEGKLPKVTKGFYGGELTKDTVTLEHIKPVSKGGRTVLSNLAIAKNTKNWARGNKPLADFFNKEAFEEYCEYFKDVKLPFFNGNNYIKQLKKTVEKVIKEGK